MIQVFTATDSDRADWEAFVARFPQAHHAFCWQWRSILPAVFGHRPQYLLARDNTGSIQGVLPLVHFESFLFGRALISLPYLNGGGILASDEATFAALQRQVAELAVEAKAKYVELRQRDEECYYPAAVTCRKHKVAMRLALQNDPEKMFASFSTKLRSQIRRPSKSGVVAKVSERGILDLAALQAFYEVFSMNMRDLGTPTYSRKLFRRTLESFLPQARIMSVWHQEKPIAAGITLGSGNSVEIPWASSLRKFNSLSPNMLLYWEAIRTACLDGYEFFDFGRSSIDSGPYRFKVQWGTKPLPLSWYYPGDSQSVPSVDPQSERFRLLSSAWSRLPLFAANTLGPFLTRSIP